MSDPSAIDFASGRVGAPSPHVALQRVCVRMLFDPAFVERVYSDASAALEGLGIPEVLTTQIVSNDRRLWGADRLRRRRALDVLMKELKVTTALALHETRELAFLESFFASTAFHDAVQSRDYMALAFVAWLEAHVEDGRLKSPHLAASLAIEGGMARARREHRDARRGAEAVAGHREGDGAVCAVAGTRGCVVPSGTLETIQYVETYLFESGLVPALALCDDAPRPDAPPALGGEATGWLLEARDDGHVDLSGVEPEYAHLVEACTRPLGRGRLIKALARHGVKRDRVNAMVASLLEAGVLRAAD